MGELARLVYIAKSVFQVHGVDSSGAVVIRKRISRAKVVEFFANLPACLIGIEACPSAHHWGRELQAFGHTVRLMPPSYVKAYLKRSKNDANDAAAICEAVTRPSMRFVPIKTKEQQTALMLHRARQLLVRQRTMLSNVSAGSWRSWASCRPRVVRGSASCSGSSRIARIIGSPRDPRYSFCDSAAIQRYWCRDQINRQEHPRFASLVRGEPPAGRDPGHRPNRCHRPGCRGRRLRCVLCAAKSRTLSGQQMG